MSDAADVSSHYSLRFPFLVQKINNVAHKNYYQDLLHNTKVFLPISKRSNGDPGHALVFAQRFPGRPGLLLFSPGYKDPTASRQIFLWHPCGGDQENLPGVDYILVQIICPHNRFHRRVVALGQEKEGVSRAHRDGEELDGRRRDSACDLQDLAGENQIRR